VTDAQDFVCLLRRCFNSTQDECEHDNEDPHPFFILDFGFPIVEAEPKNVSLKNLRHLFTLNPKSKMSYASPLTPYDYLITQSARANTFAGTVSPVWFALSNYGTHGAARMPFMPVFSKPSGRHRFSLLR
jgi:hypothetical protein